MKNHALQFLGLFLVLTVFAMPLWRLAYGDGSGYVGGFLLGMGVMATLRGFER